MADDETYRRAAIDLDRMLAFDAGRLRFVPAFDSTIAMFMNADAGVGDGGYDAFACLNETYRGKVQVIDFDDWAAVFVEFQPVLDVVRLAPEYASLPAVRSASPSGFLFTGCPGYLCLERRPDGQFTWLANLKADCGSTSVYLRLRSQADGGWSIEDRQSPPPMEWFEEAPRCAARLSGRPWRYPDGGVVVFDAGR